MSIASFDDPRLEPVVEVVKALIAAVGHSRLYGLEHRETHRSLEVLASIVNGVCSREGPLTFQASLDGLNWGGVQLTDDREDERGVGRHLHREGIASLQFNPGIDVAEARRLVGALRVNLSLPEHEEETLESLLWQAELQSVEFQACTALMEAEALSGRAGYETREEVEQVLKQALDLKRNRVSGQLKNFQTLIDRDLVTRAMSRSEGVADDLPQSREADRRREDHQWRILLEQEDEDFEAVEQMLLALDDERDSQLLARLLMMLLRVAVARRADIKPRDAFRLARRTVEAIYQLGDPVGILDVLTDARRLIKDLAADDLEARKVLNQFYRLALPPMRVATMLSAMDPEDPREQIAMRRLLGLLPIDSLLSVLEMTGRDADRHKTEAFLALTAKAAGRRLLDYLAQHPRLPLEQLVPLIHICRHCGGERERQQRRELIARASPPVMVAILQWYGVDLPDADIGLVLRCLGSRQRDVRQAAIAALAARRPRAAARTLRMRLSAEDFNRLDPELQADWCIAYGRVDRDAAVSALSELLTRRLPLFNKAEALATLEAAARGLAATGSPLAMKLLRQEAKNPRSVRGAACQKALRAREAKREH